MIEETCEKLIDSVEKQGKMDVRFDYSYMLSAMITARIMGYNFLFFFFSHSNTKND